MHCIVRGLAKSRTQPSDFHTTTFRDKSTMQETVFSRFSREMNPPIRQTSRDFSGRPVVKDLPANAGGKGFIPGPGISHVPQSSYAREPQLLSLSSKAHVPQPEKLPQWEACTPQLERKPALNSND